MTIKEVCEQFNISQDTLRYYERVGVIPKVHRTPGGTRDYREEDLGWVENAICMRSAGMSVDSIVEYVRLYQSGDETYQKRLDLLTVEKDGLTRQKEQLEKTIELLNHKITIYENAVKTGVLDWNKDDSDCGMK